MIPLIVRAVGGALMNGAEKKANMPSVTLPQFTMSVQDNIAEFTKTLSDIQRNQIPFATATALTKIAQDGQESVQGAIPHRFKTTKKWWSKQQPTGIKINPANKFKLYSTVYTNAYFAGMQESGGTKTPRKGRNLAIPTDVLTTGRQRKAGGAREAMARKNTYIEPLKSGKQGIWRRKSKKHEAELLYVLAPSAQVKPRFGFASIMQMVVNRRFSKTFEAQLAQAIKTAKP